MANQAESSQVVENPDGEANQPLAYIQIGQILCPVTGNVITHYFADGKDMLPSFYLSHFKEVEIIGIGHNPSDEEGSSESDASLPMDMATSYDHLIREPTIWADLNHPNVVRYYEAWIENRFSGISTTDDWEGGEIDVFKPCMYVQLELCESSLKTRLMPGSECMVSWIDKNERIRTLEDILHGLAYLHNKGLMHGDISSANILYGKDGRAKITDFGLARHIGKDVDFDTEQTLANPHVFYRAPERKEVGKPCTKSDIFSLGILLFEMMQPATTFGGRAIALNFLASNKGFPDHWKDLPAKKWVEKMVDHDLALRPSVSYLKENLEHIKTDILHSQVAFSV
ncbi:uncharacterized protein LOC126800787 [Argentina anserina]|uniref:uncharacterized protein LOC126800787 n=1 Tax=Argentina anserina TaxID=57926 RepID=UPI0021762123|nr:uncharacterized protein LOC126800787 [Potentilla anserina]